MSPFALLSAVTTAPESATTLGQTLAAFFSHPSASFTVAQAVLVLTIVGALGLAIGHLQIKGVGLGAACVMFVGLAAGAMGVHVHAEILDFVREFGLILFVFTIGMQVGPGFFASLRRSGLGLNIAAAAIVLTGVLATVGIHLVLFRNDPKQLPQAIGLLCGAVTNTPSLGAAKDALLTMGYDSAASVRVSQAYAIAYPLGVVGVLGAILTLRAIFRVDIPAEARALAAQNGHPSLEARNFEIANPALDGKTLRQVPTLGATGVVVTRLLRNGEAQVASPQALLRMGDVVTAVGPTKELETFELVLGKPAGVDVRKIGGDIDVRVVVVSHRMAVGPTIEALGLRERFGVQLTRIRRSGFELPVTPASRLQYGDRVTVVGERASLPAVVKELGDSASALNKPLLAPVLVGIALGVIVGLIPIAVPGLPAPMRLGLAGGPLLVAILLSRLYKVGPLVWYMPSGANYFLRELGIVLFLACVGVKGGAGFVEVLKTSGPTWLPIGFAITFIPVMAIGILARAVFKMNFLTLTGLLAGSMTDPPALAFSQQISGNDAPTAAYATVYPLVMLLRIFSVQAVILILGAAG